MRIMNWPLYFLLTFTLLQACGTEAEPPAPEPYFKAGEYGGEELPGTEHLTWIAPSPDGKQIAVIRERTPEAADPVFQLWLMNADGSNPELIAYNVLNVNWNPDGERISMTYNPQSSPYAYLFTLNLETKNVKRWNGKEEFYFNKTVEFTTGWFSDGNRMLIGVNGKAYQQEYERGVYSLNVDDSTHQGPFRVLFTPSQLGNNDRWVSGIQYTENELSANKALFDLETEEFYWLTEYNEQESDSARLYTDYPAINPSGTEIILPKFVNNAWQLFQVDLRGNTIAQLTQLGGHQARWPRGKDYILFKRDTHKAPGARYIPYKYNFSEGTEEPLWPNLPDSVPVFPEFSSQHPLHLFEYVE